MTYKEENTSTETTREELLQKSEEAAGFPSAKKRKTYAVTIVMQKTTFLRLKNVAKCVDAHLSLLQSLVNNVNECVQYLIKKIELNLPKSYIDYDIVKLTLRGNYDDIERNVRTQINDLNFLDMYFNIIFLEITTLRFNEILRIILTNRSL